MSRNRVSTKCVQQSRIQTDVVAIELDPARFAAVKKQGRDPSVQDVLEVRNFNSLLVQWLLAYLQRKMVLTSVLNPAPK